jgi:hypothetical protein
MQFLADDKVGNKRLRVVVDEWIVSTTCALICYLPEGVQLLRYFSSQKSLDFKIAGRDPAHL